MKKIVLTFFVFAFIANVSAQIEIDSLGQVGIGSSIGTLTDVPLTFKVNNSLVGFTGSSANTNVSFGYGSLSSPLTGNYNVAIGVGALSVTTGYGNTANGYRALARNTTGGYNTANGYYPLYNNTTGSYNTANGYCALYNNTMGSYNTANGLHALYNNTTGSLNIANGYYALYNNTTGSRNTAIGFWANVGSGSLDNATAIGSEATATQSNQVVIGNYTVTSVGSAVTWSTVSDGRAKKNIRSEVPGLAFINQLQPITYNLDLNAIDELQKSDDSKVNALRDSIRMTRSPEEKEIEVKARANKEKIVYSGFIAQDVEKAARSVEYDFSGVDAPENGKGAYGLRYSDFVVPLVKAVQELSAQNDQLRGIIDELKQRVEKLENNK